MSTTPQPAKAASEIGLSPEERAEKLKKRKELMQERILQQQMQGVLPFQSQELYEQINPLVRSALFGTSKAKGTIESWETIFTLDSGSIQYQGPFLNTDHEELWTKLLIFARGYSLTKPIYIRPNDMVDWLFQSDAGGNFKKVSRLLEDLRKAQLKISSRPALQNLYNLLTSPDIDLLPDGKFFKQFISNRMEGQIKAMGEALSKNEPFEIDMNFIQSITTHGQSKRKIISLDPLTCLFFDGVNTTLLPLSVMNQLDPIGRRILPYVASHRNGAYPISLEKLYRLTGSKSDFEINGRRFKSQLKSRLNLYVEQEFLEPGWQYKTNQEGQVMVYDLKIGPKAKIRSRDQELVSLPVQPRPDEIEVELDGDYDEIISPLTGDLFQNED